MTAIGHIYKIICTVDEKFCYIGSTFNRLSKRFKTHRSLYKRWLDGEPKSMSCYPAFKKHGVENFKIVLIRSYEVCREHVKDRRHLEAYETLWICRTKCCNQVLPIQYLKKERAKQHHYNNREQSLLKMKKYRQDNLEQILKRDREYLAANRDQISEKRKEKMVCECGCTLRKTEISRHRKSKRHIDLMASK